MSRSTQVSMTGRVVLAIVLLLGFYALALSLAAFLVWWPFQSAEFSYSSGPSCLIVAAMIVWAIFPRWDRFPVPGPQLMPAEHPRLFEQLRQVAHATGERMPDEVF